jgi:hypothetical protein
MRYIAFCRRVHAASVRPLCERDVRAKQQDRAMRLLTRIAGLADLTPRKPAVLIGAVVLCFASASANAAEIHDGDTGYVAKNSIWFTDETV